MSYVDFNNSIPTLCPDDLGEPADWKIIDLDAAWPEILPLIRNDEQFAVLMEAAIREFHQEPIPPELLDIWGEHAPWQYAAGEYWVPKAVDAFYDWMHAGANTEAKEAQRLIKIYNDHKQYEGPLPHGETEYSLYDKIDENLDQFYPQSGDPDYMRMIGASHSLAAPLHRALTLWRPQSEWAVAIGDMCSIVVDINETEVAYLLNFGDDPDNIHPLEFAQAEGTGETWDEKTERLKRYLTIPSERSEPIKRQVLATGDYEVEPGGTWPVTHYSKPHIERDFLMAVIDVYENERLN